jgi:hypothetical protein
MALPAVARTTIKPAVAFPSVLFSFSYVPTFKFRLYTDNFIFNRLKIRVPGAGVQSGSKKRELVKGGNHWTIRRLAGNLPNDVSPLRTTLEPKLTLKQVKKIHR